MEKERLQGEKLRFYISNLFVCFLYRFNFLTCLCAASLSVPTIVLYRSSADNGNYPDDMEEIEHLMGMLFNWGYTASRLTMVIIQMIWRR